MSYRICLTCRHWQRSNFHLETGYCRFEQPQKFAPDEWRIVYEKHAAERIRFQFEDCDHYRFGEIREPSLDARLRGNSVEWQNTTHSKEYSLQELTK